MVKLTLIPKEVALTAPISELPHPARRVVRDEIRELARGTLREAEVFAWLDGWTGREEAQALLAELRAGKLPMQPIEVKLKTNAQSNQHTIAALNAELEASAQAEAKRRREVYEVALHHAIEQKFAWQQQEAAWGRRYDPLGLYGAPNYKTEREDW